MTGLSALGDPFGLKGRIAVVTGASKGIGKATAEVLATAGAHVIVSSRNALECQKVVEELRALDGSAEVFACNIGKMDDISNIFSHVRAVHGGLDILVNNAVLSPWRTIAETDVGLFTKAVDVNLRGYWYMAAEAAKLMQVRGVGSIVNIASVAAVHPEPMLGLYATLKTALLGMSRAFALEYGSQRIRVNSILPGVIDTKLAEAFDADTRSRILRKTPLGHLGAPRDIGYAVQFLCSPAARYITGTSLIVDGGLTIASL